MTTAEQARLLELVEQWRDRSEVAFLHSDRQHAYINCAAELAAVVRSIVSEPVVLDLTGIQDEIEKQLNSLDQICYGVDVREKYDSTTPVIDTVVKRSDAMHALLFVKAKVKAMAQTDQETP